MRNFLNLGHWQSTLSWNIPSCLPSQKIKDWWENIIESVSSPLMSVGRSVGMSYFLKWVGSTLLCSYWSIYYCTKHYWNIIFQLNIITSRINNLNIIITLRGAKLNLIKRTNKHVDVASRNRKKNIDDIFFFMASFLTKLIHKK